MHAFAKLAITQASGQVYVAQSWIAGLRRNLERIDVHLVRHCDWFSMVHAQIVVMGLGFVLFCSQVKLTGNPLLEIVQALDVPPDDRNRIAWLQVRHFEP